MTFRRESNESEKPFLMPVVDVFTIKGRGVCALGRVQRGSLKQGDSVEIVGFHSEPISTVAVDFPSLSPIHLIDEGFNAGILFKDISESQLQRGMVVAVPGSIRAYRRFSADLHLLETEQGGRKSAIPLVVGYAPVTYRPQFYIYRTSFACELRHPNTIRGDYVRARPECERSCLRVVWLAAYTQNCNVWESRCVV